MPKPLSSLPARAELVSTVQSICFAMRGNTCRCPFCLRWCTVLSDGEHPPQGRWAMPDMMMLNAPGTAHLPESLVLSIARWCEACLPDPGLPLGIQIGSRGQGSVSEDLGPYVSTQLRSHTSEVPLQSMSRYQLGLCSAEKLAWRCTGPATHK